VDPEKLELVASQPLIEVIIPLLERLLGAKDAQVRYFACAGLGDYADYAECQARVKQSLAELRKLRNDGDPAVRSMAYTACGFILGKLAASAANPEDRKAAAQELEQLQKEKGW
jgi:hypothetical protein